MSNLLADHLQQKDNLRRQAYLARNTQADKDHASRKICLTLLALPEYRSAKTIFWYIHCRSEVRTLSLNPEILEDQAKSIVIPYCTLDQYNHPMLGLWKLDKLDELEPGMWNIPEPPQQRRTETCKQISMQQINLVVVPGVGFDRRGGRLGNGKGYYDRILAKLKDKAILVGIGYESQLFDVVPMDAHDIYLDKLVTEKAVYQFRSGK
ncbi:MAG: 5-formyltetrahydrofolate cyclo-ligase [Methylococcales bacterium]